MTASPSFSAFVNSFDKEQEQRPHYRPDPMAQALELRAAYALLQPPERPFEPGDLVREKVRVGRIKRQLRNVLIVVRPLRASAYDDLLRQEWVKSYPLVVTGHEPDLVCGDLMSSDGATMSTILMSSLVLERVSDDDLRQWGDRPAGGDEGR